MTDTSEADVKTPEPTATETQAREMGWRPKDEWQGDDSGWMEPERFIERKKDLAERASGASKAEISRLNRTISEMSATIDGLKRAFTKVDQQAFNRAKKELEARAEAAVEAGDTDAYKAVGREMKDLEAEAKETAKDATKAPSAQEAANNDPDYLDWHPDNAWYNGQKPTELRMTKFANDMAPLINKQGRALYDAVTEAVKEEFPSYFENPRRKEPGSVEGGRTGGSRTNGQAFTDLPKDAKDAYKELKASGSKLTEAKYAEYYFEQE